MTGMLGHVPAGEAVARMWRDATGLAAAPSGGLVVFCLIFGMPALALLMVSRGRRWAWGSLAVAAVLGGMWFAFYAVSAGRVLGPAPLGLMIGWLWLVVVEIAFRKDRAS